MKLNIKHHYESTIIPKNIAQIRLPRLISDGMVLQRDARVKIWGWAGAGEKVTIHFIDREYSTTTDADGKWMVMLPALEAGGPYKMEIKGSNTITLNNILIGDVWVCSGQSNMELPMARVSDLYAEEIAHCDNPAIRQFIVPDRYDFKVPQQDLQEGSWESANPESILKFTAVGYFFAKALFEKYHVPIGLINASVGGSSVEAWLSEEALQAFPEHLETAKKFKDDTYLNKIKKEDEMISSTWYDHLNRQDQGLANAEGEIPWFDISYDASAWPTMQLPAYWEDEGLGHLNGVVWFRKEINVPSSMIGKPARLLLGRIVDSDTAYVNGTVVGTTSYQYPPRKYDIPENLLKEGKNVIVIRVINKSGQGGFIKDKSYHLSAGGQIIDLKGEWQYKVGAVVDPLPDPTFFQHKPLGLFNGMIAPILNYAIKGVIWYQGESNTSKPLGYHKLFSTLISDWRVKWNQGNFPFLYVQLANYMQANDQPSDSNWAVLREEQLKMLAVSNTAMAVTIDIGEWNDLHPLNKKDVGNRLALAAQYVAYGDNKVVYSGPIYQSMKVEGGKITITFTNTGRGLVVKGNGDLKHFAIAGPDKKFVWAEAKIKGHQVVVWNDHVPNPVAVRYAWADNPEGANLYNKEGLPASPFRTDE
ncbi:sialate O-acetylesterase [Petroclostridium xylanilyticum]|uniref:sialate O-acetylesterase n=1 Tax=Petroclostridium xylanilyticum TaxID=1792311 RepID=UPI000B98FE3D|nr:sialate O-acetylesterase [Petroclostridium xylanilyticum]